MRRWLLPVRSPRVLGVGLSLFLLSACELVEATEEHATVLVVNQTGVLLSSVSLVYDIGGSVEGSISATNLANGGTATFTGVPDGPCEATGCPAQGSCFKASGFAPNGGTVTLTLTPTSTAPPR